MSIIITYLSSFGIIHASDSNLTAFDEAAGPGKKTFEVPHLKAGLTIAGSYAVGDKPMNTWMSEFINKESEIKNQTLAEFSEKLRGQLESDMTVEQKMNNGCLIHIAGYVKSEELVHPEFFFVRNIRGIDQTTGKYTDPSESFFISEDFWKRDAYEHKEGATRLYVNGFPSGRATFIALHSHLDNFFYELWSQSSWEFRAPKTLKEEELFVDLRLRIINTLFGVSDYKAPYIGGSPQIFSISAPQNTIMCRQISE